MLNCFKCLLHPLLFKNTVYSDNANVFIQPKNAPMSYNRSRYTPFTLARVPSVKPPKKQHPGTGHVVLHRTVQDEKQSQRLFVSLDHDVVRKTISVIGYSNK